MQTHILLAPVISEKSMRLAQDGSYTFFVEVLATKGQIIETIEQAFKVNVTSIKTVGVAGERKRTGKKRTASVEKKKKKAIVTLKKGQKIALFDTQE